MNIWIPVIPHSPYMDASLMRRAAISLSQPGRWNLVGFQQKSGGKPILRFRWPEGVV